MRECREAHQFPACHPRHRARSVAIHPGRRARPWPSMDCHGGRCPPRQLRGPQGRGNPQGQSRNHKLRSTTSWIATLRSQLTSKSSDARGPRGASIARPMVAKLCPRNLGIAGYHIQRWRLSAWTSRNVIKVATGVKIGVNNSPSHIPSMLPLCRSVNIE
jgi:hypothetical protein